MTTAELQHYIDGVVDSDREDITCVDAQTLNRSKQQFVETIEKHILKMTTEAYDKGYQAGANQMSNDPCVCGFWGKK